MSKNTYSDRHDTSEHSIRWNGCPTMCPNSVRSSARLLQSVHEGFWRPYKFWTVCSVMSRNTSGDRHDTSEHSIRWNGRSIMCLKSVRSSARLLQSVQDGFWRPYKFWTVCSVMSKNTSGDRHDTSEHSIRWNGRSIMCLKSVRSSARLPTKRPWRFLEIL
jgi:hypothetical protein